MRRLQFAIVAISLAVLLVMLNVRLVMSPLWLQIEYTRPGFPADPFGLTTEDRLYYGRYAVDYLIYQHDIAYLGNLRFPDGRPLYNERELVHMRDVQWVTIVAFVIAVSAGVILAFALLLLRRRDGRAGALRSLRVGALLTIALLLGTCLLAIVGWEFFFTGFHQLFFADGTWYFLTSDTLIRLFPEQFWFDSALLIGGLTMLQSLAILVYSRVAQILQ
jgi:integral membrane protein (TIGR01906 family)